MTAATQNDNQTTCTKARVLYDGHCGLPKIRAAAQVI